MDNLSSALKNFTGEMFTRRYAPLRTTWSGSSVVDSRQIQWKNQLFWRLWQWEKLKIEIKTSKNSCSGEQEVADASLCVSDFWLLARARNFISKSSRSKRGARRYKCNKSTLYDNAFMCWPFAWVARDATVIIMHAERIKSKEIVAMRTRYIHMLRN